MENKIYFDGASSPHLKNWAASAWLCQRCGINHIQTLFPFVTNNRAELIALWMAVWHWWANHRKETNVFRILGDSRVAISQYKRTASSLEADKAIRRSEYCKLLWVPREENLAGKLLEKTRKSRVEGGEATPIN